MLPTITLSQFLCWLSFLLFFLIVAQVLREEPSERYTRSGEHVRELLLNGNFNEGITYWRPFHWFGFYAVEDQPRYIGESERSLLLLVPEKDGSDRTERTIGLFQFVDQQRLQGSKDEATNNLEEEKQEEPEEITPELSDDEFVRVYRLEATARLGRMVGGARFRIVIRGQSVSGEHLIERDAQMDGADAIRDPVTGETIIQTVCLELESSVALRYISVYALLSGPPSSSVQLRQMSLLTWRRQLDPLRGHHEPVSDNDDGLPKPGQNEQYDDDEEDDDAAAADDDEEDADDDNLERKNGEAYQLLPCTRGDAELVNDDDYQVHAFFFQSRVAQRQQVEDVSIATQLTTDRLELLTDMYRLWEGPMSVVLYVADLRDLFRLEEFRRTTPGVSEHVDVHVVYADSISHNRQKSLYPINFLRNVALQYVTTKYVLTLDVDFLPSPGLLKMLRPFISSADDNTGFVLPAFEVDGMKYLLQMPRSKVDLLRLKEAGTARQIHVDMAPESQRATNFDRWANSDHPYLAMYEPHYEPFFIVATTRARFDTRFKGYGFDKASQAYALSRTDFSFLVLPQAFIVHRDHGVPTWRKQMPQITFTIWSNIYEFVFETEVETHKETTWAKLWHSKFDWIDLSSWDDIEELNNMPPPTSSFKWTNWNLVLLGVLLLVVWRNQLRAILKTLQDNLAIKQLKST